MLLSVMTMRKTCNFKYEGIKKLHCGEICLKTLQKWRDKPHQLAGETPDRAFQIEQVSIKACSPV